MREIRPYAARRIGIVVLFSVCLAGMLTASAQISVPKLGFKVETWGPKRKKLSFVTIDFAETRGWFGAWCYENSTLKLPGHKLLKGGIMQLRHECVRTNMTLVTLAVPKSGLVEFYSWLEPDGRTVQSSGRARPRGFGNMCFQVRRAPDFAEEDKQKNYPEFVKRCFIFTKEGCTFLHNTARTPLVTRKNDPIRSHAHNTPFCWVQRYSPRPMPEDVRLRSHWSTDLFTKPVIGIVSKDGKYLVALAKKRSDRMSQMWHHCLHNADWHGIAVDDPRTDRVYRRNIYFMKNDPDALLQRVESDFAEPVKIPDPVPAPEDHRPSE